VVLVPNNTVVTVQDVMPAAMALGLDPEALDMAALRGSRRGARGGGPGGSAGSGATPPAGAESSAPTDGPRGGGALDSLRAKVQRGEISRDSLRAIVAARRGGAGGGAADATGSAPGSAAGIGGTAELRAGGITRGSARPAVVFVVPEGGTPEPRLVQIGLNDWDNTQVVSGLEAGATVAVIGAAQLQAQQAEMLQRMRSRMGGGPLGRR
jgi:HlyD family secretion protein